MELQKILLLVVLLSVSECLGSRRSRSSSRSRSGGSRKSGKSQTSSTTCYNDNYKTDGVGFFGIGNDDGSFDCPQDCCGDEGSQTCCDDDSNSSSFEEVGTIVGIAVGIVVVIGIVAAVLAVYFCRKHGVCTTLPGGGPAPNSPGDATAENGPAQNPPQDTTASRKLLRELICLFCNDDDD